MDISDFYNLVERMRYAQREYFRTRRTEDLHSCKDLERQVDAEIQSRKEAARERDEQRQLRLF